jgi:hypothetical protein
MSSPTYTDYKSLGLKPPFVALFAAPRKAGKTVLMSNLLREIWSKQFDNIVIISPTLRYVDDYEHEDIIPDHVRFIKIDSNLQATLQTVIDEQQKFAQKHKDNPEKNPKVETLVILDDCIDTDLFKYNSVDNVVDAIAHTGRHYNLSVALTSQSLARISPEARKNAEALFIFAPHNYMDFERVLEEYVPRDWRKQLRQAVTEMWKEPYAFLIVDGSPERRQHFKMRLRKGFSELLFELDHREDEQVHVELKQSPSK